MTMINTETWCLCSDFCTRSASRSSPENCHSTHRGEEISFWISYFLTSWTIAGSSLPDTWLKRLDPPASETGTEPESATWLHLFPSKVCCFGCCLPIPLSKGKFHFNPTIKLNDFTVTVIHKGWFFYWSVLKKWLSDNIVNPIKKVLSVRISLGSGTGSKKTTLYITVKSPSVWLCIFPKNTPYWVQRIPNLQGPSILYRKQDSRLEGQMWRYLGVQRQHYNS